MNYTKLFDNLHAATRVAAHLASATEESEPQTVAKLHAYVALAADAFGLELVPKSNEELQ